MTAPEKKFTELNKKATFRELKETMCTMFVFVYFFSTSPTSYLRQSKKFTRMLCFIKWLDNLVIFLYVNVVSATDGLKETYLKKN